MEFLKETVREDDSYFGFHMEAYMEVDSRDDWCCQDGAIQNKNNYEKSNVRVERSNNLQRCLRCSKPLYYDSLSLLQHNLTHLKVMLEKLPDEIFHFYEQDQAGLECCEEPEEFLVIKQYSNAVHSDTKPENGDIKSENNTVLFFDIETPNTDIEDNNNTEFIMEGKQNNIDNAVIKFEIEEIDTENSRNEFLGEEQLKNIEHNNNKDDVTERKLHNFFSNIVKFEIEEICMDQFIDVETSKEIEHSKNNIESRDTSKEQQQQCDDFVTKSEIEEIYSDNTSGQFVNEENSNADIGFNNNIESETKRQLQRFDGAIIKCEIEEIHSDNSTDQFIHVENTKKNIEVTNEKNKEKEKQQNNDSQIIKSEIEVYSENSLDLLVDLEDADRSTGNRKGIDITKTKQPNLFDCYKIKINIEEVNDKKKVRKSNDKVTKPKKKPRQCHICKKFISFKHLGQHISEIHTQNNVECEICDKVFKCKKNMRTHMKNVHAPKSDNSLKIREKITDNSLMFRCDHCQNTFYSKDCLQKHMKNVHGKAVKCEICGSRLASEIYLATHMRRVHYDDGDVHSCDICGKIFKSPRYLRVHMKNSHYVSSKIKLSSRKK